MRISLDIPSLEREGFLCKKGDFCGVDSYLITVDKDKRSVAWSRTNKIFRSSIWSVDGELLSASFPKFTNLGESPDIFPPPKDLNNVTVVEKLDGSTFIVDYVNGKLNVRTRGTFDYKRLGNAQDFEEVLRKYPGIESMVMKNHTYTFLFEIVSPNNPIVVRYPEVDVFLIGAVDKLSYRLVQQHNLNELASVFHLQRPNYYLTSTLEELIRVIKADKKGEGCCLYSNDDQDIHKIKSDDYLRKHRLKSHFDTPKHILDYWFSLGCPAEEEFRRKITEEIDFETMVAVEWDLKKLFAASEKVEELVREVQQFIKPLSRDNRKTAAMVIKHEYPNSEAKFLCYTLLDGKKIEPKMKRKLIESYYE